MTDVEADDIRETYAQKFLETLRETIDATSLNPRRLPRWLESADIRTAYVQNTLLLMIESREGSEKDKYEDIGKVGSDVEFFLEIEDYPEYDYTPPLHRQYRDQGEFPSGNILQSITFDFSEGAHFVGMGYDYHPPIILLDTQLRLLNDDTPIANRYIPFALFIHIDELTEPNGHIKSLQKRVIKALANLHDSTKGDEYQEERKREEAILGQKSDSIVILGNFDDGHKQQLREVRDFLEREGYKANLIDELPAHKNMSLRDKVRAWTATARFSVMVDSEASGHNNEYEILREQESILAILRPENSGSTFMMGPDIERDRRRSVYHYQSTPLEVIQEAVDWAEQLIEDESEEFSEYYPWR